MFISQIERINPFKDYYFIESQFRVEYAPQNSFCYFLDSKADNLFKRRVRNFASCFKNVIVPDEEISVQSEGHNMTMAHLICLKHLRSKSWKYVVLLQVSAGPLTLIVSPQTSNRIMT